ncbi:MAG: hypothetical protein P4L27_05075 [Ignavibacteriaceae bacterium]|nr:hypothetical protein [Ignavibacteriaceae bacterium]
MKKLLSIAAIFIFLNITGCYTIVWSPGMDFPTSDNSGEYYSTDTTGYYNESDNYSNSNNDDFYYAPYYGPYAPYYHTPWWYSVTPPTVSGPGYDNNSNTIVNRNGNANTLRNSGDGRGRNDRNTGDIINTPPVTVSSLGYTSGTTTTNSNSNKTNSNTTTNPRQNTGAGSVRNNDGTRNDGGRK